MLGEFIASCISSILLLLSMSGVNLVCKAIRAYLNQDISALSGISDASALSSLTSMATNLEYYLYVSIAVFILNMVVLLIIKNVIHINNFQYSLEEGPYINNYSYQGTNNGSNSGNYTGNGANNPGGYPNAPKSSFDFKSFIKSKNGKITVGVIAVVLVAFITFLITSIGFYQYFVKGDSLNKYLTLMTSDSSKDISQTLDTYKSLIEKYYLGDIDEEGLKEGAIKGYIEGLGDPYTEYISKEDMNDYLEDTMGNFVGIGIYMVQDTESNRIMVLSPIKNSPAERAGIKPGDLIMSVNGEECTADDMTAISTKIKGEEGTTVKLQILRGEETLDFEIKRENIVVNPVEGEVLENNIGYIEFSSFDENTAEEFKTKFEELQSKGITSLIIDLRNNGGGIVDEALQIADYIADKDSVLLYEVDKDNNETVEKSENDPIINMPIIILTNENTASSSEILAGALKDLGKAKIVGTKTYGKGVIQQILTLPDGSGLKITTEKYLTPNRTEINEIGIEPDETVELPEDVDDVFNIDRSKDTQLQKAIQMLKES